MSKFRVTASITCEGELFGSTPVEDEVEVPRIFRKRLESLLRTSFGMDVAVTIIKCKRVKEKDDQ